MHTRQDNTYKPFTAYRSVLLVNCVHSRETTHDKPLIKYLRALFPIHSISQRIVVCIEHVTTRYYDET